MNTKTIRIHVNKIPNKIKKIYELSEDQSNKSKKWLIGSFLAICVSFIVMIPWTFFSIKTQLSWEQAIILLTTFAASLISGSLAMLGLMKVKTLSFEKELFMKLFRAYDFFERFKSLTGSDSQDPSDLKNTKKLLTEVAKKLVRKKRRNTRFDLTRELYEKYGEIGKLIQTKILYLIEKDDIRTGLIQQKILDLLKMFSDPKMSKLDSCIKSINEISETGPFKPKKIFLEKNPRIRSWGSHLGKFIVSLLVVTFVIYVLSIVFSTPISELTVTTIGISTFALFAAWEFKPS